eukprot:8491484-Pyramimonas_sp.AAC.1
MPSLVRSALPAPRQMLYPAPDALRNALPLLSFTSPRAGSPVTSSCRFLQNVVSCKVTCRSLRENLGKHAALAEDSRAISAQRNKWLRMCVCLRLRCANWPAF